MNFVQKDLLVDVVLQSITFFIIIKSYVCVLSTYEEIRY